MTVDLWESRAVPILEVIAARETVMRPVSIRDISQATGIPPGAIVPEVERLIDGGYIPGPLRRFASGGDVGHWLLVTPRLTDKGARALRIWPEADHVLEALVTRAEQEQDPIQKTKLQALVAAARSVGVEVIGEVLAAAAKHAAGLP